MPSLDVFKSATNVKVDPDKPLQQVRFRTLEVSAATILTIMCHAEHVWYSLGPNFYTPAVFWKKFLHS